MDPAEYLTFVPLLFYGIALTDLLGQWRRFFDRNYFYLPYFLTTLVFTEVAVWDVYTYLEVVSNLEGVSYRQYWSYLIKPILFLLTVSALTPESDQQDTEGYFKQRLSLVYGLMAVFIASHSITYRRIIAIILCLAIAVSKKLWLIYVVAVVWLLELWGRMI